jgi:hypothetical protein
MTSFDEYIVYRGLSPDIKNKKISSSEVKLWRRYTSPF